MYSSVWLSCYYMYQAISWKKVSAYHFGHHVMCYLIFVSFYDILECIIMQVFENEMLLFS